MHIFCWILGYGAKNSKGLASNLLTLDILILLLSKKVRDQYEKGKFVQIETLPARYYLGNITIDKNSAYPLLKKEKKMQLGIQIRQRKYLNNIVEQDHRFIKKYTLYRVFFV